MIEEFICWLGAVKIETWIAIIAVIVSMFTVIISNRNARKLVLNVKLEEMAKLSIESAGYYTDFHWFYTDSIRHRRDMSQIDHYNNMLEKTHTHSEWDQIQSDIIRLGILNDGYLRSGKLHYLISVKVKLYLDVFQYIQQARQRNMLPLPSIPTPQENSQQPISEKITDLINIHPWYKRRWDKIMVLFGKLMKKIKN